MSDRVLRITALAVAAAAFHLAAPACAQDGGDERSEMRKIVKQIKEDLDTLVEDLARLSTGEGKDEGDRVVKNIDELLEGMGGSGDRIVSNIDELLAKMKKQSSSSSGGGGGKSKPSGQRKQRPGQRRDRNQQGEKDQHDQPHGKKPDEQDGNSKPNGGEDERMPKQGKDPRKPPESDEERVPFLDDREVWGTLPPEVRQILIESSYRDYFPEYEREISDYLKSLNRRR